MIYSFIIIFNEENNYRGKVMAADQDEARSTISHSFNICPSMIVIEVSQPVTQMEMMYLTKNKIYMVI